MSGIKKDSVDQTLYLVIKDATTGAPKTGVTLTTFDLTYTRTRAAAVKADCTALATVSSAHSDNGAFEVDATNAPGLYRFDVPDAAFADGSNAVHISVNAAGCDPAHLKVTLLASDATDLAAIVDGSTTVNANMQQAGGSSGGVAGFSQAIKSIIVGTVGAASTTTSIVTSAVTPSAGAVDCWKGLILKFAIDTTTAALRGQGTDITANTSGATPTLTVTALTTAPVSGDIFTIE